ncbi:hypothetical protein RJT34_15878 [Clitoria ternatea]|uniref:LCR n=1 Tax=Clitoria ternatea TaxID=43366 RepID=A0AAN9J6F0_CLITE
MTTLRCESFLFGILFVALILASPGPAGGIGDIPGWTCGGHGPCATCKQNCINGGFQKGGVCIDGVCCCKKNS